LRNLCQWVNGGVFLTLLVLLVVSSCTNFPPPVLTQDSTSVAPMSYPRSSTAAAESVGDAAHTSFSWSAHLGFEHIAVEQGLSQSTIYSILQDSRGYLWFGTWDGLNKYDGRTFKVYRNDPEDPDSLSDNIVWTLYEDSSGTLWVGTDGGLNKFDPETDRFIRYQYDPDDPQSLSHNIVGCVFEDSSGDLWIGTWGGGLNRLDRQTGKFSRYRHNPDDPDSLSADIIGDLYEDSSGTLWIGTWGGLDQYDREKDGFIHYRHDPTDPYSLSNDLVRSILLDSTGTFWVGTAGGGLNQFNPKTTRFAHLLHDSESQSSLSNDVIWDLLEDSSGTLWVITDSGLNRWDRENRRFMRYLNDPNDPYSLSENSLYSIYQDRSGVLWVGSASSGLNKLDPSKQRFVHYYRNPNDPSSLSHNLVSAIFEDAIGVLWIGTYNGLNRLDPASGKFAHYQHDPKTSYSLSGDEITAIDQDPDGFMWVGTNGAGLNKFDPRLRIFKHYQRDPDQPGSLSADSVLDIFVDHSGALWVGTYAGGLDKYDQETDKFINYRPNPGDPRSYSNIVNVIDEDGAGFLWLGTSSGLFRFDPKVGQFIGFHSNPDSPSGLASDIINAIYPQPSGLLWIGTNGGLTKFDQNEGIFTRYTTQNGLPDDLVWGILEDDHGYLWISTNNGLARFDPQTEAFKVYDTEDGLQGKEFRPGAFYKSERGEMFFGGVNGFNSFYPERVWDNPNTPPVVLTQVSQGGEEIVLDKSISAVNELTFRWPNNFFEFEFAALSYTQPAKNQYAYMLEGFDEGWNNNGTKHNGRYTNLPGGTYTLRLKGSNNDGVWNEAGTSLLVTIVPPFWGTWWFRGLVALFLMGVITGSYRLRIKSIEDRNQELEELVSQRTRTLEQRTDELSERTQQLEERTIEIERRRQELEALYRADAVMHRYLSLDQVLQALVDVAVDILHADKSSVLTWDVDQERWIMKVARGFDPESMAKLSFKRGEGITGHVAVTGEPALVVDAINDPRQKDERPEAVETILSEGIRSFMHLPIKVDHEVFGVFNISFTETHAFGEDELRLFTSLAQRAAVFVENARLFRDEKRRAHQFQVLTGVGSRITSILDIEQLLVEVTKLVQQTFGYYHVGIGLIESDEVVYRVGSGALWDDPAFQFKPARLKVGVEGLSGWVAANGEALIVPDVSKDSRYVWMRGSRTRSETIVPITIKGEVIGILDVQSDRLNSFDETDLLVLQSLANQTAVAIQNARLYERAQQVAVMEERNRLARDLHDSAKQKAFAALAQLGAAGGLVKTTPESAQTHLAEAESLVYDVLQELDILIQEMHPVVLKERGLVLALRDYVFEWAHQNEVEIDFKVEGERALPLMVEQILYRIAQEALANVARHSQARTVDILLEFRTGITHLAVCDDGCGFDPKTTQLGMGLRSMRERSEMFNGSLHIESNPGDGTRIIAEIPV
jgi:signal transduction histidine kinase/ligand-binding sensor domain-containing protein